MTEAANELLGRESSSAAYARIVDDVASSVALRVRAAEALGRVGGYVGRAALARALESNHARLVRQAAGSLGRVGIATDREILAAVKPTGAQAKRVLSFARSMISYRLGLGTDLLDPPRRMSKIATGKARSMEVTPIVSPRLRAVIEATTASPVPLTGGGALRVNCDGVETIVALSRDMRRAGAAERSLEINQVVGTVLRPVQSTVELTAHLYVLTHPCDDETVEVFAVRRTGVVALYGLGTFDSDAFKFELRSVEGLRSPTMLFVGRLGVEAPTLGFSQAFVAGPPPLEIPTALSPWG